MRAEGDDGARTAARTGARGQSDAVRDRAAAAGSRQGGAHRPPGAVPGRGGARDRVAPDGHRARTRRVRRAQAAVVPVVRAAGARDGHHRAVRRGVARAPGIPRGVRSRRRSDRDGRGRRVPGHRGRAALGRPVAGGARARLVSRDGRRPHRGGRRGGGLGAATGGRGRDAPLDAGRGDGDRRRSARRRWPAVGLAGAVARRPGDVRQQREAGRGGERAGTGHGTAAGGAVPRHRRAHGAGREQGGQNVRVDRAGRVLRGHRPDDGAADAEPGVRPHARGGRRADRGRAEQDRAAEGQDLQVNVIFVKGSGVW